MAESIRIELARQRKSARALARHIGWSSGTSVRRLRGETPLTVDELVAAAGLLGLEPAQLLERGLADHALTTAALATA